MSNKNITIVTFNTYSVPLLSSNPAARLKYIATELSKGSIDVINFQEVHTYYYLHILKKYLPSFPHISYKNSILGPKGGLVTFAKIPIEQTHIISFKPVKRVISSFLSFLDFTSKGVLITEFKSLSLKVFNIHLTANKDNDWSVDNRYYSVHKSQLIEISHVFKKYNSKKQTIIVTGDFNIAKDSDLYDFFLSETKLSDAFGQDFHATYHKECLPKGRQPHCIDYIFYTNNIVSSSPRSSRLFENKVELKNGKLGYLSDHIALLSQFVIE